MPSDAIENIRSEEVQDILGTIPGRFIRWGNSIIFIVIALLLLLSWFIKYPDIIVSKAVVTSLNPAVAHSSHTTGKIVKLFVSEHDTVKGGTILALIENSASYDDMFALKVRLDSLRSILFSSTPFLLSIENSSLKVGELQMQLSDFVRRCSDMQFLSSTKYYSERKKNLARQITQQTILIGKQKYKYTIQNNQMELERKKFEIQKGLMENGFISKTEFATNESLLLDKKYAFETVAAEIASAEIQLAELRRASIDLEKEPSELRRNAMLSLRESYMKLGSEYELWEQRFIIRAAISGSVSFSKYWHENQYVKTDEEVLSIVPSETHFIVKAMVPIIGAGKVKAGQRVIIKMDSYPYSDFGTVEGEVEFMSLIPSGENYMATIELPSGLITSANKTLGINQNLYGTAEIMTDERRLIERAFGWVRYLTHQNL
jgi:multidrug resistance efflux pump